MGRSHFFTDRAQVMRGVSETTLGTKSKSDDEPQGGWIPCRLREPDGDTNFLTSRHELQPTHVLHFDAHDEDGQPVSIKQSDTVVVRQLLDDGFVDFEHQFRIIGAIQPKRRRTRLVSYTALLYAPEVEY